MMSVPLRSCVAGTIMGGLHPPEKRAQSNKARAKTKAPDRQPGASSLSSRERVGVRALNSPLLERSVAGAPPSREHDRGPVPSIGFGRKREFHRRILQGELV